MWMVVVYKFDYSIMGWVPETSIQLKDDKALVEFLRANASMSYRYEITRTV